MDLYKEHANLRCFTHQELVQIVGSENAAAWQIRNYLKKGYIERIRRDLYAVISMETGQAVPNRYQIASRVTDASYVSHHSAFEFYGYANQVFYDVYFASEKRVKTFSYDGLTYCPLTYRGSVGVTETNTDIRVTSIERTVIDSIADFEKIGGLEELLRCLLLIPTLDSDKLLASLELYNRGQLYQKTGYILESIREELSLPEYFFAECEKHSSSSKTYLFEKQDDFVLFPKWKLFAPKNLQSIINKGVTDYDAV